MATLAHVKQVVDRRLRFYRSPADLIATAPPELRGVVADSLAITGHNVHPLAKLRLGFSAEDSALYGPENFRPTNLKLIGVHPDLLAETGDVTAILRAEFPENMPNTTLRIVPVHPWQWEHVIGAEFAREIAAGTIMDTGATLPVLPTLSLRTALTFHPGTSGRRLFIKTSVDATLTSTRRSMSRDSALGTPLVAAHLAGLGLPCDLLPEIAGWRLRRAEDKSAGGSGIKHAHSRVHTPDGYHGGGTAGVAHGDGGVLFPLRPRPTVDGASHHVACGHRPGGTFAEHPGVCG